MTFSDYAIDIALIAVVLLQIRGRRLTTRALLLPVILVGYVAVKYLHGIPTAGNDLLLVVATASVGATLGILSGLFTSLRAGRDGIPYARAGLVAATLWVVGTGTRLAFQVYASHGGAAAIGRFSAAHHITSEQAWVAALILMAMGEALARTGVLALRARAVSGQSVSGQSVSGQSVSGPSVAAAAPAASSRTQGLAPAAIMNVSDTSY